MKKGRNPTGPDDYEFLKECLETMMRLKFGNRVEECIQSLAGRTKGYLSIGGKSLQEIMLVSKILLTFIKLMSQRNDETCSDTDFESLVDHMKIKRPHLCAVFSSLDPLGSELLKTGTLPPHVDFSDIASKVQRALDLDRDEAARDNCKWASLEWKWESKK